MPENISTNLVVLADQTLKVIDEDGVLSTPVGTLLDESGDALLDEGGLVLSASSGEIPTCYLCVSGSRIYAIDATGVESIDVQTGVVTTLEATEGTVPTGCVVGCIYRDRLVLAGGDNAIYMSRQGDYTDWDYGVVAGAPGQPVAFQLGEAAEIGETTKALIPFRDSYLLAATKYSLWVVQGDPAAGGSLKNVSRGIGIIGKTAWCSIQDGVVGDRVVKYGVIFLATDGLYLVTPSGDGLTRISGDRIPKELIDIADSVTVSLVYSPEEQGVWIFLTPSSGTGTHWFFDTVRLAFWSVALQENHQPVSAVWHNGSVVLACQDGYLRSIGGDDDDGEDIESHVLLGPFRTAAAGTFGRINTLRARLAESSGAATWFLVTGDTAEEACANGKLAIEAYQARTDSSDTSHLAYVAATGTLSGGFNSIVYPRIRAEWFVLWIESTAKWAYETAIIETGQSGKVR